MRIEHKYLRNLRFRQKAWKRIRNTEQPYETFCPYRIDDAPHSWLVRHWDTEEQIKSHFKWIGEKARALDKGCRKRLFHASTSFRRGLNQSKKAKERHALARVNNGDYEAIFPTHKRDADWYYF